MAMTNSYQPLQLLTIKAQEDFPARRFVGFDGMLCVEEEIAIGVTETNWKAGDLCSVIALGTAIIETEGSIEVGDNITVGVDGKAKKNSSSNNTSARAMQSCNGAGLIRIKLVP